MEGELTTGSSSAGSGSQRRGTGISSRANVNTTLSAHHAMLLTRDRALQLKLLPKLRHEYRAEMTGRTGLDALLPVPWPASAHNHERWLFFLALLAVLSGFITPFRLAFLQPGVRPGVAAWELTSDVLYCINMLVYATCVLPGGQPDASRREIAVTYLGTTWLSRDALAAFPFDFIAYASGLRNRDALFVLGLARLRRLRRTFDTMASYEADLRLPYYHLRTLRFTLYALLHVHGFACAFGFLAQREGAFGNWMALNLAAKPLISVHDVWAKYLLSLYWATTTFCGVGYGDVTPQTKHELVFTTCYMLVNFALSAFVVGNMSSLATAQEAGTRMFREQTADMEAFFKVHSLPKPLCDSLRAGMQLRQNDAMDHREVLQVLPPVLRRKCQRYIYYPMLKDVYIFEKTPSTFARVLCTIVTVELFLPGTAILTQGLPAFDLFVITSGVAEYVLRPAQCAETETDELFGTDGCPGEAFDAVSVGDCFGEAPFVFRMVNPWSVRAQTLIRTLSLNRDNWKAIKASRPDLVALIEDSVAEHMRNMAVENAEVPDSPWPAFAKLALLEYCNLQDGQPCAKPERPSVLGPEDAAMHHELHQPRMSVAAVTAPKLGPMRGE